MRELAATLFAAALAVVLTPPFLLPKADGAWIIRKVSAAGSTELVNEDFAETGTPSSGLWTVVSASVDFDDTTYGTTLNGENMTMSSSGSEAEAVWANYYGGTHSASGLIEANSLATGAESLVGLRGSNRGPVALLRHAGSAGGSRASLYADGADQSTSATFAFSTNTLYYWWIDLEVGGSVTMAISTTASKPTAPTDTSTQWAATHSLTNTVMVDRINFRTASGSTNAYSYDDILVETDGSAYSVQDNYTAGTTGSLGPHNTSSREYIAIKFTAGASYDAVAAAIEYDEVNSATGSVFFYLYSHDSMNDEPDTLLGTATVSTFANQDAWTAAEFASPVTLSSGTTYWIASRFTPTSGTNYLNVLRGGSGRIVSSSDGATWSLAYSTNFNFRIYQ